MLGDGAADVMAPHGDRPGVRAHLGTTPGAYRRTFGET